MGHTPECKKAGTSERNTHSHYYLGTRTVFILEVGTQEVGIGWRGSFGLFPSSLALDASRQGGGCPLGTGGTGQELLMCTTQCRGNTVGYLHGSVIPT